MKTDLQTIPYIGVRTEKMLTQIGISRVSDLRNKDPKKIYDQICIRRGYPLNKCLMYVMRLAVYYASHKVHDPQKLHWCYWKDK